MITEVIIDRRLLNSFKKRALRKYPNEYARVLYGRVEDCVAEVHATGAVQVNETDEESIDFDMDEAVGDSVGNGLICLGTVHTHPDGACAPSDADLEDARSGGEIVVGICAIRKTAKRRFVSWGFFSGDGKPLELTVGE